MQADNRFCRNCLHHRDGHISYPGLRGCYGEDKFTVNGLYYTHECHCPEYVPKENLEYLEYCEAKRNSNAK
jgi:hypothetical protein